MKKKNKEPSYQEIAYNYTVPYIPKIIQAIVTVIIFYFIALYTFKKISSITFTKDGKIDPRSKNKILMDLFSKILYYIIIITGVLSGLVILGFNLSSLLVVFGSMGLAIALSLQNTMTNASSGIMILALDYYNIGDLVKIDGNEGVISEFNLFTTSLKDANGLIITLPNLSIVSKTIINYTKNENVTISVNVEVPNAKNNISDKLLNIIKYELITYSSYIINVDDVDVSISSIDLNKSKITCNIPIKSLNYYNSISETTKIVNNIINKTKILSSKESTISKAV
jgi:small-conductance mechanosensitive channel